MAGLPDDLKDLFLTEDDLPGMQLAQSTRDLEEPGDEAFERCGALSSGFNVWQAGDGAGLRRFVDIRWRFRSVAGARRYHRLRRGANAEGLAPLEGLDRVGEGNLVFGGPHPAAKALGLDVPMAISVFSVGPVVAKVFVSGVPAAEVVRVGRLAESRVTAGLEGSGAPAPAAETPPADSTRWPKGETAYDSVLAGLELRAGRGIGDALTFHRQVRDMYDLIGGGDEDPRAPFHYAFVRGAFGLVVQGVFDPAAGVFRLAGFVYWDDPYGALRTPEGLTIGSTVDEVLAARGPPAQPADAVGGQLSYPDGIAFETGDGRTVQRIVIFPP